MICGWGLLQGICDFGDYCVIPEGEASSQKQAWHLSAPLQDAGFFCAFAYKMDQTQKLWRKK
jgi:hypothetical protein